MLAAPTQVRQTLHGNLCAVQLLGHLKIDYIPTPTMSRRYADVVHYQGERPGVRDIVRTLTLLAHEEVFLGRWQIVGCCGFDTGYPAHVYDHVRTATVASGAVHDIAFRCECVAVRSTHQGGRYVQRIERQCPADQLN